MALQLLHVAKLGLIAKNLANISLSAVYFRLRYCTYNVVLASKEAALFTIWKRDIFNPNLKAAKTKRYEIPFPH